MASLRNRSLLFRILQQARPCWLRLTGIAVLGLLSIPLALLFPLPLKIAVDSVLGHQPLPAFMSMSWMPSSSAGALVLAVGLLLGGLHGRQGLLHLGQALRKLPLGGQGPALQERG